MLDALAANPLLTVTLVLALGTLVGQIPFGPVRFGPAGALFVGLAVGAIDARLGEGLGLVQTLGLALFVYTVGIAAGAGFFRNLRSQLPLMACGLIVVFATTATAIGGGRLLGLSPGLAAGSFAGALTATPALAAAADVVGTNEPAVGYSISYPVGVLATILVVAVIVGRTWPARRDVTPAAGVGLIDISVEVSHPGPLLDVPGFADGSVLFSYLRRDGETRVVHANEQLQVGDRVLVVGPAPAVRRARKYLGRRVDDHLAHDRREVDYRRFIVSNRDPVGRSIAELDFHTRFGGVITRVRRGDLDLLARDDLTLELGDRVRVVVPRGRLGEVGEFLGDSERRISEVDAFSMGIGLALGLALGLITIPLPGGIAFALGSAAGPLVVGMVLGRLERTGPLVWGLPGPANLTIRQLGLLLFLGTTGLSAGQAFASQAFTPVGLRTAILAVIIVIVGGALLVALARIIGISPPRTAGALAGFVGQPAILAYANSRCTDERVNAGYATLFALGIITKIILVQFIVT